MAQYPKFHICEMSRADTEKMIGDMADDIQDVAFSSVGIRMSVDEALVIAALLEERGWVR